METEAVKTSEEAEERSTACDRFSDGQLPVCNRQTLHADDVPRHQHARTDYELLQAHATHSSVSRRLKFHVSGLRWTEHKASVHMSTDSVDRPTSCAFEQLHASGDRTQIRESPLIRRRGLFASRVLSLSQGVPAALHASASDEAWTPGRRLRPVWQNIKSRLRGAAGAEAQAEEL